MKSAAYRTHAVPCTEAVEVPPPPPPSAISIFAYGATVSIEDAFMSQLPTADVSRHGAGMLARLEHRGAPLWFVACGSAADRWLAFEGATQVACRLRAGAPSGAQMLFRGRSILERIFRPRDVVALDHPLDRDFLVRGQPELVRALLDREVLDALSWMVGNQPSLVVTDGVIELAWIDAFDPARPMLQGPMLDVVTTIADRLRACFEVPVAVEP